MAVRIQLALMSCLVAVGVHAYLTMHYYPLKLGFATGQSVCNLNSTFNCDPVVASNFSAFLGMPVALWGAVTNAILFLLILFSWWGWSENPERLKRWTLALAGVSVGASVVMGAISVLFMHNYCLFCISAYALSLITFFSYKGFLKEPFFMHIKGDLKGFMPSAVSFWPENMGILTAYLAIPLSVFLIHRSYINSMGDVQIQEMVDESVNDWMNSPKQEFVAKPSLVMGPSSDRASLTLVEFADFRCGHCKHASYTLDAWVKGAPDVRFEFYSFPLDGACNDKIQGANGVSCRLATAVLCAEKEGKGWELHHLLYDRQDDFLRTGSPSEMDPILAQCVSQIGLNWERMQTCLADPASQDAIRAQAKQGALVDVRGTPTIFANGKLLTRGQITYVLEAIRQKALAMKISLPLPKPAQDNSSHE